MCHREVVRASSEGGWKLPTRFACCDFDRSWRVAPGSGG